jgi:hypothetical protein
MNTSTVHRLRFRRSRWGRTADTDAPSLQRAKFAIQLGRWDQSDGVERRVPARKRIPTRTAPANTVWLRLVKRRWRRLITAISTTWRACSTSRPLRSLAGWRNVIATRRCRLRTFDSMERETGIEPATSGLGSLRSTAELLPRSGQRSYHPIPDPRSRIPFRNPDPITQRD